MSKTTQRLLLVGLPGAGKTSFVVATWHVVSSDEIPGSLTLVKWHEGDREYIEQERQRWLACKQVNRNKTDVTDPILLTVRERNEDFPIQVTVPDLAGETYKQQFEERGCTPEFFSRIRDTTGLLLFVNPNNIAEPTVIDDVNSEQGHIDDPPGDAPDEDFHLSKCCAAAKLVDLLQSFLFWAGKPLRLALVVSAYDEIEGHYKEYPEKYVEARLALLYQFLIANSERLKFKFYGVSAQGADYDNDAAMNSIMESAKCSANRIRIVADGDVSHDITSVLRWLAEASGGQE